MKSEQERSFTNIFDQKQNFLTFDVMKNEVKMLRKTKLAKVVISSVTQTYI
jgi:hypothetical protein